MPDGGRAISRKWCLAAPDFGWTFWVGHNHRYRQRFMNAQLARLIVLLEKAVTRGDRLAATNLRAQIAKLERA